MPGDIDQRINMADRPDYRSEGVHRVKPPDRDGRNAQDQFRDNLDQKKKKADQDAADVVTMQGETPVTPILPVEDHVILSVQKVPEPPTPLEPPPATIPAAPHKLPATDPTDPAPPPPKKPGTGHINIVA